MYKYMYIILSNTFFTNILYGPIWVCVYEYYNIMQYYIGMISI